MRKISLESLTPYQLGILWAIARFDQNDGGYTLLRHRERYFLERIQPLTGNAIQTSRSSTGIQYRLKMFGFSLEDLTLWGWTPRNAETRNVPPLSDYHNFLRAWIEIHSSMDYAAYPRRKDLQKVRFRIYGNRIMMASVSQILADCVGVGAKRPVACGNGGKTCGLYYQSPAEIESVFKYVDGSPSFGPFWDRAYQMLKNPMRKR